MNSAPQLSNEDRQEYEQIVDEVLEASPDRPDPEPASRRLSRQQLRTMAIDAAAVITSAAEVEYRRYLTARDEYRRLAQPPATERGNTRIPRAYAAVLRAGQPKTDSGVPAPQWTRMPYGRRLLAAVLGLHPYPEAQNSAETPAARRQGPSQVTAAAASPFTRAPILCVAVAVVLLLASVVLQLLDHGSKSADAMITGGLVFAALAVVTGAVGALGVALRGSPSPAGDGGGTRDAQLKAAMTQAHEAWRNALIQDGIVPFLKIAQAGSSSNPPPPPRMPRLGYARPDFGSPDGVGNPRRAGFSSPDLEGSRNESE